MAKKEVGIVIITYNNPRLIVPQLDLIKKYCKDEHEVLVFDNSTDARATENIGYHTHSRGHSYFKTNASARDSSVSATFALNVSYVRERDNYDYFLYLDHDSFPLREFSVKEELGDAVIAGVGQQKAKMYMHTGYLMFNNKEIDHTLINFECNDEFKLDTGGNLYKVLEAYPDRVKFWDEAYEENPYFKQGFYNFYAMINKGLFMHFLNGSGWNKLEKAGQDERINALLNVLYEKTNVPL